MELGRSLATEGGNDIGNKYTRSILDVDWAEKLISEGFKAVGQKTELYISWEPLSEILIYIVTRV